MKIATEKLIIRQEQFGLIAFYTEVEANRGNIMSMTFNEGHGEASLQYYRKTKKPTQKETEDFISRYEKHYDCKVILKHKLTQKDLRKIWGQK
ncbi:MAG: hypothetical protein HQ536_02910 [Parcubacteria group bacterium]|nr:hypothetical protein [Parcubacteria group bacterium]